MLELSSILESLAEKRPIFHSEADFQHSLAWEVHQRHPHARIRLEVPFVEERRGRIDIILTLDNQLYAIELKYKKTKFNDKIMEENFDLSPDLAYDISCYDYIKDIGRLERYRKIEESAIGYAIMLTNDTVYWKKAKVGSQREAFCLSEGRNILNGCEMDWSKPTSNGTKKDREKKLTLNQDYTFSWRDYGNPINELGKKNQFRYLLVRV